MLHHVLPRSIRTRSRRFDAMCDAGILRGCTAAQYTRNDCHRMMMVARSFAVTGISTSHARRGGTTLPSLAAHHPSEHTSHRRLLSTEYTHAGATIKGGGCGCVHPDTGCPFYILQVAPDATRHQVKRAYYARCLESHPDTQAVVHGASQDRPSARSAQFIAVQQAYERARHLQPLPPLHRRPECCPLAVSPACSPRTNEHRSYASYDAFARGQHAHHHRPPPPHPHGTAAYRHDAGVDFGRYQPPPGQSHPLRYTTNQRFQLLVLAVAVAGVGMQYWRLQQHASWVHERLDRADRQAGQALKAARERARKLGWQGQKALLEQRIDSRSK